MGPLPTERVERKKRASSIIYRGGVMFDNLATSLGGMSLEVNNLNFNLTATPKQSRLRSFSRIAEELNLDKPAARPKYQAQTTTITSNIDIASSMFSLNSQTFDYDFQLGPETYKSKVHVDIKHEQNDIKQNDEAELIDGVEGLGFEFENPYLSVERREGNFEENKSPLFPRSVEEKQMPINVLKSPDTPFLNFNHIEENNEESFNFRETLNTSKTMPFKSKTSNVVESSLLYNLDLDNYYSATSPIRNRTKRKDSSAYKRTKDEARYGNDLSITRAKFEEKQNARKNISMAASLENAPILKLRRRNIERKFEGYNSNQNTNNSSSLRLHSTRSQTRILSQQIQSNRNIFKNPFENLNEGYGSSNHLNAQNSRWVGSYSPQRRKALIKKFLEKRKRRVWNKKIRYAVRKNFADSRLRVKGRFVGKEDEASLRESLLMSM